MHFDFNGSLLVISQRDFRLISWHGCIYVGSLTAMGPSHPHTERQTQTHKHTNKHTHCVTNAIILLVSIRSFHLHPIRRCNTFQCRPTTIPTRGRAGSILPVHFLTGLGSSESIFPFHTRWNITSILLGRLPHYRLCQSGYSHRLYNYSPHVLCGRVGGSISISNAISCR